MTTTSKHIPYHPVKPLTLDSPAPVAPSATLRVLPQRNNTAAAAAAAAVPAAEYVSCIALSHNHRLLAVGTSSAVSTGDNSLRVFDIFHSAPTAAAAATSPSGSTSGFRQVVDAIRCHDDEKNTVCMRFRSYGVLGLAFNPRDSTSIATAGCDSQVCVHNTRTRQRRQLQRRHVPDSTRIEDVAWTNDGKTIVAVEAPSSTPGGWMGGYRVNPECWWNILMFDAKTGQEITAQKYAYVGKRVSLSNDGAFFVSGRVELSACPVDQDATKGVVFRGFDDHWAGVAAKNRTMPKNIAARAAANAAYAEAKVSTTISCIAISPCSQFVAAGSEVTSELRLWCAVSGEQLLPTVTMPCGISSLDFAGSSTRVFVGTVDGAVVSVKVDPTAQICDPPFLSQTIPRSAYGYGAGWKGAPSPLLSSAAASGEGGGGGGGGGGGCSSGGELDFVEIFEQQHINHQEQTSGGDDEEETRSASSTNNNAQTQQQQQKKQSKKAARREQLLKEQPFDLSQVLMPAVCSLRVTSRYVITVCKDNVIRFFPNSDSEWKWLARVWVLRIRCFSKSKAWRALFQIWNVMVQVGLYLSYDTFQEMKKNSIIKSVLFAEHMSSREPSFDNVMMSLAVARDAGGGGDDDDESETKQQKVIAVKPTEGDDDGL